MHKYAYTIHYKQFACGCPVWVGAGNLYVVSTYMLYLPDKKKLEEFMLKEIEEMGM
jgi:hypothetical protein